MALNNFLGLFQQQNPDELLGGRYKLLNQLGAGGFGRTFLARDTHLPDHPQCVIKQLKPQFSNPQLLETARRLFDTEARVLYKLGTHNQIPQLLAHFECNQDFYLAQELIEGQPLTKELIADEPWPETRVIALLRDILQVLSFVHEENVIHRDIKPPNLIRRRDGKIVLIDFGAVKQVSTQFAKSDTGIMDLTISIGTQGYVPKEQLGGHPRFSSDVYAVGILGIQTLVGVHPRHLREDAKTGEIIWRSRASQVSEKLADIIDTMVSYDFRSRYPTAREALEALNSLVEGSEYTQDTAIRNNVIQDATSAPPDVITATDQTVPLAAKSPKPPKPPQEIPSYSAPTVAINRDPAPVNLATKKQSLVPQKLLQPQIVAAVGAIGAIGLTFGAFKLFPQPQITQQADEFPEIITQQEINTPNPPPVNPQQQAEILLEEAEELRVAQDYRQAVENYQMVIELQPNLASAHWGSCYSYNQLSEYQQALVACNQALEINPEYAEAFSSQGVALKQQQNLEAALVSYNRALALKPDLTEAWINKGTVLHDLARYKASLAAYERAIELAPDSADAWANRGAALWALKRFDEGIKSMDKALDIDPDHANANDLRQQARRQIGR